MRILIKLTRYLLHPHCSGHYPNQASQREDTKNKCILYKPHTVSSCHGQSRGPADLEVGALLRLLLSHSWALHREAGCRAAIVGGLADVRWRNILLTCKDPQKPPVYLQHPTYQVMALVPSSEGGTRSGGPILLPTWHRPNQFPYLSAVFPVDSSASTLSNTQDTANAQGTGACEYHTPAQLARTTQCTEA